MTPLSLVILTKNEAHNIERCIQSVPVAQDVVVLDSESIDQTVVKAQALGARTFVEPWQGFFRMRKRATELAKHDWILALDADEALSEESLQEIKDLLTVGPKADAYAFPRRSFHLGRWIHHGGWYPDRQIRLYHRGRAQWAEAELHEKIKAQNIQRLKNPILHWVFRDLSHQVETNNRYSSLGAEQLAVKGKKFSLIKFIFKPWGKFLEAYIWKQGFRDGLPGFIIAVGAAYSMFLKFAKLWEMERLKANHKEK